MGKARDAASEYFRCVQESDLSGLEKVLAEEATLSVYDGEVRRGREDILGFYETRAMGTGVSIHPQSPIEDADRCAVEIVIQPAGRELLRMIDVFTVDEAGRITSVRIYRGLALDEDRRLYGGS